MNGPIVQMVGGVKTRSTHSNMDVKLIAEHLPHLTHTHTHTNAH